MKYLLPFCLIIYVYPYVGYAGDRVENSYYTENHYNEVINISRESKQGVALGLAASSHHFDVGRYPLQWSVALGAYDNRNAASFAMGKRISEKSLLLNSQIGIEENKVGFSIGLSGTF